MVYGFARRLAGQAASAIGYFGLWLGALDRRLLWCQAWGRWRVCACIEGLRSFRCRAGPCGLAQLASACLSLTQPLATLCPCPRPGGGAIAAGPAGYLIADAYNFTGLCRNGQRFDRLRGEEKLPVAGFEAVFEER